MTLVWTMLLEYEFLEPLGLSAEQLAEETGAFQKALFPYAEAL